MYVCVCMYIYIYVCVYVCTYTHTHTHTNVLKKLDGTIFRVDDGSSRFLWACLNTCTELHGIIIWKTLSFRCMFYLLQQLAIYFGTLGGTQVTSLFFFTLPLLKSKTYSNYKTTKTTFKYGSRTSNDEELLSSCSDLDTFDDLLAEVLNQNKESFSPKTKMTR